MGNYSADAASRPLIGESIVQSVSLAVQPLTCFPNLSPGLHASGCHCLCLDWPLVCCCYCYNISCRWCS
jgi:hypothetical protein